MRMADFNGNEGPEDPFKKVKVLNKKAGDVIPEKPNHHTWKG